MPYRPRPWKGLPPAHKEHIAMRRPLDNAGYVLAHIDISTIQNIKIQASSVFSSGLGEFL